MRAAFWIAAVVVFYSYLGYVAWLWICSRVRPWPLCRGEYLPFVSVVMVVRDEAKTLPGKIRNLSALDYPADKIEFVVASDGSLDETSEVLAEAARSDSRWHALGDAERKGKASRLNEALAAARGEIVLFVDARQNIEFDALRLLMENFADDSVGCASGELMLGDPATGETEKGMGVYWRVEKKIRELESASGSVVGATGALYAARRGLLIPLPPETILDDVFLPMHVARHARVVFDERARAWDSPDLGAQREFGRKVRTLTGNYQLLQIAPWLMSAENPLRFRFISHKLMRLLSPFALAVMLVTSGLAAQPFYRGVFFLQLFFYGLSLIALTRMQRGPVVRLANAVLTFIVLNTAAVVAFANFLTGRKEVWVR